MSEEFEAWFKKQPLPTIGVVTPKGEIGYSEEALEWAFKAGQATRHTPSVNQELLEALTDIVKYTEREPQVLDCSDCMESIDSYILKAKQAISKANAQMQQVKEKKCI